MAEQAQGVIAHLIVEDAAAALKFYKKGLGASETMRMPADDGKRILHAEIAVNGARVFVMDDFPEHNGGKRSTPAALRGTPVTLHLEVKNCDAAVKRAVSAGATLTLAPMDAFWGARYAQVVDPFGHSWSFAHPLKKKKT
jgi:PhnB protein